jgi:hypothetical protein
MIEPASAQLAIPDPAEGRLAVRAQIEDLETALRTQVAAGEFEQTIFDGATPEGSDQCKHYYGDGVYLRSLLIPAGTCVIGKLHKQARVCVIASGRCVFTDEFQRHEVEGPWIGEFLAGTKTAVFAITDTLWIAAFGTDIRDPIRFVEERTAINHENYAAYLAAEEQP